MTGPRSGASPTHPRTRRTYGPAAGEPPPWADPRRGGSLAGLAGGLIFIGTYSTVFGTTVAAVAWAAGVLLVLAAVFALYVRPVSLGPFARPRTSALLVYGACVVGELLLIGRGSEVLRAAGEGALRPSLIAGVVGLHFIPFAWAFGETMFFWLGGSLTALGVVGLAAGAAGVPHAAEALAMVAGLVMLTLLTFYANGRLTPRGRQTSNEVRER